MEDPSTQKKDGGANRFYSPNKEDKADDFDQTDMLGIQNKGDPQPGKKDIFDSIENSLAFSPVKSPELKGSGGGGGGDFQMKFG